MPAWLQGLFHAPLGTALCIPFSAGTFTPKKHVYRFLSASSSQANRNQRKSLPSDCAQRSRPTKAMPTPSSLCKRVFCRSMVATRRGGNVTSVLMSRGIKRGGSNNAVGWVTRRQVGWCDQLYEMSCHVVSCEVMSCRVRWYYFLFRHMMQWDLMWCALMWCAVFCCEVMRHSENDRFFLRLWCNVAGCFVKLCGSEWLCDWGELSDAVVIRTRKYDKAPHSTTKHYIPMTTSDYKLSPVVSTRKRHPLLQDTANYASESTLYKVLQRPAKY